ncbi:helix-turn-helix domain-containing protein [Nocardia yunnanensis]|uniref:helix-turn-helix domain-containing protein n=1 Tax=Nocardia yunnanensis TaxID=2382165 RepID=UPI001CA3FF3B|nr:XRE family transcriptional regulator [Nocardia yunnanensis]
MSEPGEAPADPQPDPLAGTFGANVRRLREEAGLTLDQLSTQSTVSRAMLSKVERGEKSPTIGVAAKIAHALHTTLSDLIGAPTPKPTAAVILRKPNRPIFRDPETGFERHTLSPAPGIATGELIAHHLPAHISTGLLPAYPPGTEKQLLVLTGTLTVLISTRTETLTPGDSIYFQADTPHGFANQTPTPCEYIMTITRKP